MSITKLYVATQIALANKKGAAMVEYALLAALIAVVSIAAVTTLGTQVLAKFTAVTNAL